MTEELLDKLIAELGVSNSEELAKEVSEIINTRDSLVISDDFSCFSFGTIVYDDKHKELGIFIGPLNVYGRTVKSNGPLYNLKYGGGKNSTVLNSTYLVVTKIRDNSESENCSDSSSNSSGGFNYTLLSNDRKNFTGKYRVRYLLKRDIFPLGLEENSGIVSDLISFCGKQCIMDCSSDCILYKYKNYIKK